MPLRMRAAARRMTQAAAVLAMLGAAAHADPLPASTVKNIHDSCQRACLQQAPTAGAACENACTCAARETAATMSTQELAAAEQAQAKNQPLPPDLAAKENAIEQKCIPN